MKVLVADDNPVSLKAVTTVLGTEGYDIITAQNGADAWDVLDDFEGPQLAVVDWMMPGGDGLNLIQKIRERANDRERYIYTIMVTARSEREDLLSALSTGADDFVVKPFDPQELCARTRAGARIIELHNELNERNRALKDYNAAVMHDLRTPLIAVKMTLTQILEGLYGDISKNSNVALGKVRNSIEELMQMSENILSLNQYLDGRFGIKEPFDLIVIAKEVIADLEPIVKARQCEIKLITQMPSLIANCSKIDIKRVFINLITNALRHSPPQGEVEIHFAEIPGGVSVSVCDVGSGVSEQDRAILFLRYSEWRVARPAHGTGLGLYLCRRIVEDHGGSIRYEPREGQGSCFVFELPANSLS